MNLQIIVQIYIPIFIAVIALIFSFWQLRVNRIHNKKSVIPCLNIEENCSPDNKNIIGLYIVNKGLGPAIVEKTIFYIDEKEIPMESREDYIDVSKLLQIQSPDVSYSGFHNGEWISSNERKFFYVIELNKDNKLIISEFFQHQITKLSIYIEYKSIYGDKFILKEGIKYNKSLGLSSETIKYLFRILKIQNN